MGGGVVILPKKATPQGRHNFRKFRAQFPQKPLRGLSTARPPHTAQFPYAKQKNLQSSLAQFPVNKGSKVR